MRASTLGLPLWVALAVIGCGEATDQRRSTAGTPEVDPPPIRRFEACDRRTAVARPIQARFSAQRRTIQLTYSGSASTPPCEIRAMALPGAVKVELIRADPRIQLSNLQRWCAEGRFARPLPKLPLRVRGLRERDVRGLLPMRRCPRVPAVIR
jgi:hypothetical protein